jgi:preprotein translocase subunit SecG
MNTVLLVLFLLVTLAMIGVILVQRSEGGGLGVGSSQGMGSFMSGRGTANLLTRTTAILGTAFMVLALVLAMNGKGRAPTGSILDAPATAPGTLVPGAPAVPALPTAPASPAVPTN